MLIDLVDKLVDRLIQLIRHREQARLDLLKDHVGPAFAAFEAVHAQYLSSFARYRQTLKTATDPLTPQHPILDAIRTDNLFTEHERTKILGLGSAADDPELGDVRPSHPRLRRRRQGRRRPDRGLPGKTVREPAALAANADRGARGDLRRALADRARSQLGCTTAVRGGAGERARERSSRRANRRAGSPEARQAEAGVRGQGSRRDRRGHAGRLRRSRERVRSATAGFVGVTDRGRRRQRRR